MIDENQLLYIILSNYETKVKNVSEIKRTKYEYFNKIIKENLYCLGICGLRGVGKTTLLLQLCKENNGIYFNADDIRLKGMDLYEIIMLLINKGYTKIFIDEIHTRKDWDFIVKNVYDQKNIKICFTGSSAIELKTLKADLSRRTVLEELPPASLREWLIIKKGIELPEITLDEIIKNKNELIIKYGHTLQYLNEYYTRGGLLYEMGTSFHKTVISTIETTIVKDLSQYKKFDPELEEVIFKILYAIATSRPMELSYDKLSNITNTNKSEMMRIIQILSMSGIIIRIKHEGNSLKSARKEYKYYLPFPYRAVLCENLNVIPNIGSLREEFFITHVNGCDYIKTGNKETSDFIYKNKKFEIGGWNKKNKKDITDYLVIDGMDTTENKIPLLLFGFLK